MLSVMCNDETCTIIVRCMDGPGEHLALGVWRVVNPFAI